MDCGKPMSDMPSFVDTELPSPITQFAPQITSSVAGQNHYASGTAVIVAPYLALAARHVLSDHWERHEARPMPETGEGDAQFSVVLAQMVGTELNLWSVTRFWSSQHTDIVALMLTPASAGAEAYVFQHLTIDVKPPSVRPSLFELPAICGG
jgi:hypothetical protein